MRLRRGRRATADRAGRQGRGAVDRYQRTQLWLDERLGTTGFARKTLRKVFPDHWSFLLGEIALGCLVVLVVTGVFLTFFYTPDTRAVVYNGPYAPLEGAQVSAAYDSVMRLSFEVRAGLLVRQTHHWAALVLMAATVVHLCRVFFTRAFRRPRELNWVVGVVLLLLAMAEGLTGDWLLDDLLAGTSSHIGYSVALAIPVVGTRVAYLLFGGEFPAPDMISRFFVFHVLLLPALLLGLVGLHVFIVVLQKHTQFPGPGRTERNVLGERLWPRHVVRSVSVLLLVAAVCAGLGGLAQINPVWQYGPFNAANVTSPAQPDWYLGWVDGLLRMAGPWSFTAFGYTISENFWPAILFPGVAFTVIGLWPWIERRLSGDRSAHHLLDRPRDAPAHTATGLAGLLLFFIPFLAGGNDVLAVLLHLQVETATRVLRYAFLVAPPLTWLVAFRVCRSLRATRAHPATPTAGERLERTRGGGYETVSLGPGTSDGRL
ncbi:MAG TPA: cytochrome b N-terminal domain-containing protein [Actinomycetota bacterium]|jgi:ubiquinol-cytochrome c reductase cytochrome b subunit